jgi:hypothetical protein
MLDPSGLRFARYFFTMSTMFDLQEMTTPEKLRLMDE